MKWKIEKIKYQKWSLFRTSATFKIRGISYVSCIYYEGGYYSFCVYKTSNYKYLLKSHRVIEKVVKERFQGKYNSPQFLLFFETIKFAKKLLDSEVERG